MAKPGELTPKQAAFVREYMIDRNGTQAAIRAGYSKKTAREIAVENLTKPLISTAIDAGIKAMSDKTGVTTDWVWNGLKTEAEDFSEFSSHSARVSCYKIAAQLLGMFAIDNKQKTDGLSDILAGLNGKVMGVTRDDPLNASDDDESY